MKITCPDCDTSYDIKPEMVGPEGRSVKCARCGNRWFISPRKEDIPAPASPAASAGGAAKAAAKPAMAIEDEPETDEDEDEAAWVEDATEEEALAKGRAFEDEEPEPAKGSVDTQGKSKTGRDAPPEYPDVVASDANDETDEEENARRTIDIESLAKRKKIKVNTKKPRRERDWSFLTRHVTVNNLRRTGGLLIFLAAAGFSALIFTNRQFVVKHVPDLASLFDMMGLPVNLRGLEFRDLRTFREVDEGTIVLVVEGTIQSVSEQPAAVPAVRLSLRSEDQQEIYAWTLEPRAVALEPGANTRFRTRLTDPPADAADIQVRFVDRRSGQAAEATR
ncbi:zinc-ribbon domain-containing protein [Pannonibacter sp. Q-1]|uniref:Thioredoxin n=1 Tax=Pannonibacter phragmitetus TaxID=121719 RepID=A0A0L0IWH0_9HYPH|nr:zinc-ribbon domain-containing protein [Pannonibacter phragmitetus]ALV26832.1 thioredoxin [Pannonibacter phragmitetus]KND17787.1 thioredoxin [Pannonibacter phragmitetus]MBA4206136.1 DUF3426 domain-containing protein [Polymorphum sp.]